MEVNRTTPLQDERYLLLGKLGRGGMATVYRAFDRVSQELVALKVQSDILPAGPAHPLSSEFDLWTRLRHPNIVAAYELGVARDGPLPPGTPYLVLEHVSGPSVDRWFGPGRIAPRDLERVSIETLRALDHVHRAALIHRDLKPGNLLVDTARPQHPRIRLTDFGLATSRGDADRPGCINGSLPYVAPEVLLGAGLDGRCDLYSLGIVVYQLATGRLPFPDGDIDAMLRWHLGGPPADPRHVRPRLPEKLARFVRRLTARDRECRPASVAAALQLLDTPAEVRATRKSAHRVERVKVRLALDAVRLGGRRTLRMPRDPAAAAGVLRQARVWSCVHGLAFHDLRSGLLRPVLELLLACGPGAGAAMRRHALDRWLPLELVSDVPVTDLSRAPEPDRVAGAAHICDFLWDCARRRPLVLLASDAAHPRNELGRRVCRLLRRMVEGRPPSMPGPGGLLLLVESSPVS